MSTESKILALFEEGNPIPDLEEIDRFELDAVAYLAALRAGSRNVTKLEDKIERTERKRPSFVWLAAAAAALVVIVGSIVLVQTGTDEEAPPAATQPVVPEVETLTPEALAGNDFRVVSGRNQDLPERLTLADDNTFTVFDRGGLTTDSGTFTIEGDRIAFTSVWAEGRGPMDYGVIWAYPVCPDCNANPTMRTDKCEGVVGEYELLFDAPGTVSFKVVNDECLLRTFVANGLELEVVDPG